MNGIIEEEEMEDEGSDGDEEDLSWFVFIYFLEKFKSIYK